MIRHLVDVIVFGGLFLLLAITIAGLPEDPAGLTEVAQQRLAESGVENPVTAVLLNFRSYDTLLEVGVLLLALIATWSVAPTAQLASPNDSAALASLVRLMVPAMILGSGYVLWIGAYAPGGAFQAGAILAAALVLVHLAGLPYTRSLAARRGLLVLGLAVFMIAALLPLAFGYQLLQYPEGTDKPFILSIEAAATISIALTLGALFTGGVPARQGPAQ